MAIETNQVVQLSAIDQATAWKDKLVDYVIQHSGSLIAAVIVVAVGFIASGYIGKWVGRWLERKAMEPPVRMLVTRVTKLLIIGMGIVIGLGTAGMDVTALIAGLSVAGLGVGLALQGVLGNLVAGLTIIFTKPFRVGEYVQMLGVQGQVVDIELFTTTLLHPDRSRVVIPNRKIVGEILQNYGTIRQLDLMVGVAYGTNLELALTIIREVLQTNKRVLKDPEPGAGIAALADSSINIAIRPWTSVTDFGPAGPEIYGAIIERFRAKHIDIPFPQREVRLLGGVEGEG